MYAYSIFQIVCWYVLLHANQNESWFPSFSTLFTYLFLPLNLAAGGVCWLVWGTLNVLEARCVVDPMVDGAAASLLSATLIVALVLGLHRLRVAERGAL